MPTKEYPVEVVQIGYICDTCEEGEVIADSCKPAEVNMTGFTHKCPVCGCRHLLERAYPYNEYRRKT